MKFLVISGAPSTGKTTAINKIALWLTSGIISTSFDGLPLPTFLPNTNGNYDDFSIVIVLGGKKIIIHSATDDEYRMDQLLDVIKRHPDAEVVITSCRDIYWERDYFIKHIKPFATFFLESPVAKITRRNDLSLARSWYTDNLLILHQYILKGIPYNL